MLNRVSPSFKWHPHVTHGKVQAGPSIEEHQDHVDAVREPFHHLLELVASFDPLLLPRQHARGVDERHAVEHGAIQFGTLETSEEGIPKVTWGWGLKLDSRLQQVGSIWSSHFRDRITNECTANLKYIYNYN